jgi:hypothetical protein
MENIRIWPFGFTSPRFLAIAGTITVVVSIICIAAELLGLGDDAACAFCIMIHE